MEVLILSNNIIKNVINTLIALVVVPVDRRLHPDRGSHAHFENSHELSLAVVREQLYCALCSIMIL